jgi:predicted transcriptional regulator
MGASTTMTIRVTSDLKEKLGRFAQVTRRTKSYLAGEAVEAYVTRELQIIDCRSSKASNGGLLI